ncbi:YecA family protein [Fredinandcohnia salidurans]|uniref:YecA family protein n=1 Tax=Fredinandcohnia salidurans TaxID=2595041 RepID=A0ABW4MSR2_9BACI|nr:SEC-C metal-binding domain-containing protein [Fredinandcohnia onubensis]
MKEVNSIKQLDNMSRQGLEPTRQDTKKQEEKREQKYWSEIKVPFRLDEALSAYAKYELDDIRRYLEIKNASSLKKADLIALFQQEIPVLLKNVCSQWDVERFSLLVKIARNGGYLHAPELEDDQIMYFRKTGMLFTGSINGKKVVAIPDELIEEILNVEKDLHFRGIIKRNTEWIKLTQGLLYYYGTLTVTELGQMIEKYIKEPLRPQDYFQVLQDFNSYKKGIVSDDVGYSNRRVFDPKRVKYEHQARKNVPFYPFTKEQLLEAGELDFVDRNVSYIQLVNFIKQNFETKKLDADSIVEECVYATRKGQNLNDILQYLSGVLVFDSQDTLQKLVDKVATLMNNTREWFLKGHTSNELKNVNENPVGNTNIKIGRNEPCPCGSGKKYKKCCGR